MTVVVTRKGQTTIPKELREKYGLKEGTRLDVVDTGEGALLRNHGWLGMGSTTLIPLIFLKSLS